MAAEDAGDAGLPEWVGVRFDVEPVLEGDEHIPLQYRTPKTLGRTGYVFVVEAGGSGYVELALDLPTGRLVGATVVSPPDAAGGPLDLGGLPTWEGAPLFEAPAFDPEAAPFRRRTTERMSRHPLGEGLLIRLGDAAPDRLLRAGDAVFLFAGRRLSGFGGRPSDAAGRDLTEDLTFD